MYKCPKCNNPHLAVEFTTSYFVSQDGDGPPTLWNAFPPQSDEVPELTDCTLMKCESCGIFGAAIGFRAHEDVGLSVEELQAKYEMELGVYQPHLIYTRDLWKYAVSVDDTDHGYWGWVHQCIKEGGRYLLVPLEQRDIEFRLGALEQKVAKA